VVLILNILYQVFDDVGDEYSDKDDVCSFVGEYN
jgi:hypothetical protein